MAKPDNIIITGLTQIAGYDLQTNELKYKFDEPQKCSIENEETVTDLTGRGGRLIGTMKTAKSAKITGANGVVSFAAMASQLGGKYEDLNDTVQVIESHEVKGGGIVTLKNQASKIDSIALTDENNALGDAITSYTFDVPEDVTVITITDGADDGDMVTVAYQRAATGGILVNESGEYSGMDRWVVDAIGQDTCGNEYWVQIDIPKVSVAGTFALEMGEAQTVQNFEGRAVSSGCGGSSELYTIKVMGE